ncbi:MAG: hypothetical protein PHD74_00385 [Candidatus Krumholzibacteria bacterium]|nr:hypothetical protein [Candidatus Krumholzibacteria bacterium]
MRHYVRLAMIAATAALMIGIPFASHSQILSGLALERLGMLYTPGTGARPVAMGGAYTAVSDDAFALLYNPAGLSQIRRKELTFGFQHRSDEVTNTYLSLHATQSSSHTSLGHISVVYPYPTYRGSLVLGFGVFQAGTSDLESVKTAYLSDIGAMVENDYLQSGSIYQYHFGAGFDISPRLSLGGSIVLWDGSTAFTDKIDYADADSAAYWKDQVDVNLDGVSFKLGLLLKISEKLRAGLSFSSPVWLTYDGDGTTTYEGMYTGGDSGWTTDPDYGLIEDDYTLPMRFSGGLALSLSMLTLSGDLSYCDYSQAEYNGVAITSELDPGMEHILKETWDFHLGAEVTLPQAPIRFRGGFSYVPLELSMIEEIAYIAPVDEVRRVVADFEATRERKFFTFGVGGLIEQVLTLDLGVVIGGYEKVTEDEAGDVLTEERSITEVIVSAAYRF